MSFLLIDANSPHPFNNNSWCDNLITAMLKNKQVLAICSSNFHLTCGCEQNFLFEESVIICELL